MTGNSLDSRFEFLEVRTWPINFAANNAAPELLVVLFGEWLELLENLCFLHVLQQTVALEAAGVGRDKLSQIEPAQDFDDLLIGIVRSRTVAVANDLVHEQTAISREQGAVVGTARGEE